jgi:NAD(P)-dependent dehydrogenase (short-subunit alcohol dehydrogenase family)
VARAAAREGAAVAVLGRSRERGEALVAELAAGGSAAGFVPTDVAEPAAALASVDAVLATYGRWTASSTWPD